VTTVLAVAAGEAAYWMVRTSTEVTKTALQANPLWVQRSAGDQVTKLASEDEVTKLGVEDDVTKLASEDEVTKLASSDAVDRPALHGAPSGGGSTSVSSSASVSSSVSGSGSASDSGRVSASAALAEIGRRLSTVLGAYPVLALTDLPLVVTRTSLFLVLRANGLG
jgi:hypothetical protein